MYVMGITYWTNFAFPLGDLASVPRGRFVRLTMLRAPHFGIVAPTPHQRFQMALIAPSRG